MVLIKKAGLNFRPAFTKNKCDDLSDGSLSQQWQSLPY